MRTPGGGMGSEGVFRMKDLMVRDEMALIVSFVDFQDE